jgi:2-methylcitrate dehydratase PrpD
MTNTSTPHGDAAILISRHLAETGFDDLPASAVAAAKASILDTIGCAIAGTAGSDIAAIHALVESWGGARSSTVVGGAGLKVPAYNAVLVNAALIHQDDFDDTFDPSPCHPSSATLMTTLAVGQEIGGISGKQVITAVALANDLISRIALAINGRMDAYPWFRAPVIGIFAATAACAKVMGASADQHLNALGLALPQVAGTWASVHHPGSSVRAIRDGLAYKNAVLSAQLAMRGVRGDAEVFDGTLTAVVELMERHDLQFADIKDILVRVGDINLDRCKPVSTGMIPTGRIDLLCNLPFAVGAAIMHRGLPLQLYREPAMADTVVREAVPKVKWDHDTRQNGAWSLEPGLVEINTVAGAALHHHAPLGLGHPDYRMSEARLRAKFADCLSAGAKPVPAATGDRIVELVLGLEDVSEIDTLMSLLQ